MKSKIAQNLSYRFFKKFGSKRDSPQQINRENFIIGCMAGFRAIQTRAHVTPCIVGEKARIKIRALSLDVYQTFLAYLFLP